MTSRETLADRRSVPRPEQPAVTCLVVTYNSASIVGRCLDSIDPTWPVLVVDNASSDDTLQVVQARRPSAALIRNAANVGYGSAANVGIRAAHSPFVLLLNPDVVLRPDTIPSLLEAARQNPAHALYGPRIESPSGQVENPPKAALFAPEHELYRRRFLRRPRRAAPLPATPTPVGWISGAALMIRPELLGTVGLFDERIFLFFEETELCLRCVRAGVPPLYVPGAVVRHLGGRSTSASTAEEMRQIAYRRLWYEEWSRAYLAEKYAAEVGWLRPWYHRQRCAAKMAAYILLGENRRAFEYRARLDGARAYRRGVRHPAEVPGHA